MVVIYYCSCCFDNLNYGSETQKCATKTLCYKQKSQIHQERATCGCGSQTTHTRVNTQVLPAFMQSAAKNLIGELSRKKRKGYCCYFDILFLIILCKTNLEMGIYIIFNCRLFSCCSHHYYFKNHNNKFKLKLRQHEF